MTNAVRLLPPHPACVHNDDNRLLRVAAHLALASSVALIRALDGLEAEAPGYVLYIHSHAHVRLAGRAIGGRPVCLFHPMTDITDPPAIHSC